MANPNLELINLFPITVHPHWTIAMRLAQQSSLEPPPATRIFCSPEALIEELIRTEGTGETHNAVENILKASTEYRKWQQSMPLLRDVPRIHAYRTEGDHMDHAALAAVNQEVLTTGGYLQEDQILYSGGNFNSESIEILDDPLSTSMHPSVARWHAINRGGQITILKIAASDSVLGFAYKVTGNQKLKIEYEVLLQNDLRLHQTSMCSFNGLEVRSYDATLNDA